MPTRRTFIAATATALLLPRLVLADEARRQVSALRVFGHAGGRPLLALASSAAAGFTGTTLTLHWDELRRDADGNYLDAGGIPALSTLARNAGLAPALEIPVIDDAVMRIPGDLEQAPLPKIIDAFGELVDHLGGAIDEPPMVVLGKSVDRYLQVNDAGWADYAAFVEAVAPKVRDVWPNTQVGVVGTFDGVNGPHRRRFEKLWGPCDLALMWYVPLWNDARMKPGRQIERDLASVPSLAGKPCGLLEVGCPSGTVCGSSEQVQAEFMDVLAGVCRGNDTLRWVELAWYQDLPQTLVKAVAGALGSDLATFADAIGTLGLHHANGIAKPAWKRIAGQG